MRRLPHQTSLISGTIFEASKLPLTRWFLAMQLLTQSKNNVSALELMRQLGVCYRTAWLIKHKIMEAMRLREEPRELDGRVEIDDAYLGGERSGGKTGRGSENKVPFVAAVQTTARRPARCSRACASSRTPPRRWRSSPRSTSPPRPPWSPTGCGASALRRSSAPSTSASSPAAARPASKLPQFKAVNTLLGNLKTAISGTYHAFDFAKYAHRYLAEFQYRFNRRFNMRTILTRLARRPRRRTGLARSVGYGRLRFIANQEARCRCRGWRSRRKRSIPAPSPALWRAGTGRRKR